MENKEFLKNFYKEFLDICCESGLSFFESGNRQDFYTWGENIIKSNYNIFWSNGATKLVLWEDELPYVLKIPFLDERADYKDYCEIEVRNYEKAKHFPEILDCFAWTEFLFEYKGFPVYIMEKVDCDEDELSSRAYDASFSDYCSRANLTENDEDFEEKSDDFSDNFYSYYDGLEQMEALLEAEWGWKICKQFMDFCQKEEINDCHTGNWGYRDDHLVIVDYSGI